MPARVVQRRRLDHSNQGRRFRGRHLGQVLVEKIARRLRHPVNRRAVVLAHRHVIDVALEDLVLAQTNLEHRGDGQLLELAAEGALVPLQKSPRQLLRDGAGALGKAMRPEIGNGGLDDANRIDSRMVIEVAILAGQQSLDQVRLQITKLNLDAFGGRTRKEPANHFRLEHHVGLGHAERIGHERDSLAVETDADQFSRILLGADVKRSQVDGDRVLRTRVFARSIRGRHLRIAQLREPVEQAAVVEVVAGANRKRRGEDRGSQRGATLLDQRGNLAVQLRDIKSDGEEREQESAGDEISHAPSADSPLARFLLCRIRLRWRLPSTAHRSYCLIYKVMPVSKPDPSTLTACSRSAAASRAAPPDAPHSRRPWANCRRSRQPRLAHRRPPQRSCEADSPSRKRPYTLQ